MLSAAAALANDDAIFLQRIRQALCVDEVALLQKNVWALSTRMSVSLASTKLAEG